MVSGGGQEALVGRDAQPVHLRVRMLDGPRADSRERLPEPDCVVVTGYLYRIQKDGVLDAFGLSFTSFFSSFSLKRTCARNDGHLASIIAVTGPFQYNSKSLFF